MSGMVVITSHSPNPSLGGSSARMVEVVKHFHSLGVAIDLLHVGRRRQVLTALPVVRECVRRAGFLCLKDRTLTGYVPKVTRTATRPPSWFVARVVRRGLNRLRPPPAIGEAISRFLNESRPELVWLDHTWLAPLVVDVRQTAGELWVVDTHDVMYLRDETRLRAGLAAEAEISRAEETELLRPFDLVLAIQDEERRVLMKMLPGRRVVTLGHSRVVCPLPSKRRSLLYVGSKIDVNVHGLLAFIAEAWPEIAARSPKARLEIAGRICQSAAIRRVAANSGRRILLLGEYERSEDVYDGPAVAICPLWAGSGLKIKMVEALSHGKATIATPVGAQGLGEGVDRAFVLARTAKDFIGPAVRALEDAVFRRQWETAAAAFARARFSPHTVWRETDMALAAQLATGRVPARAGTIARAA